MVDQRDRINFAIDPQIKHNLKVEAAKEGRTYREIVTELIVKWLARKIN